MVCHIPALLQNIYYALYILASAELSYAVNSGWHYKLRSETEQNRHVPICKTQTKIKLTFMQVKPKNIPIMEISQVN